MSDQLINVKAKSKGGRIPRHGHARRGKLSPEYRTYQDMLKRCCNPKSISYKWYGGRGITVCDRWRESFEAFLEDMGPKPTPKHTIDRIENDGNYEPGNCRWATKKEQSRNQRTNRMLTHNGQTRCLEEWAEITGIKKATLWRRLTVQQWPVSKALTTPVRGKPAI